MEKIITLTELRKLNAKVSNGKISAGKMVEIINEKAFIQLCKGIEKQNEQIKHLLILIENKNCLINTLENGK